MRARSTVLLTAVACLGLLGGCGGSSGARVSIVPRPKPALASRAPEAAPAPEPLPPLVITTSRMALRIAAPNSKVARVAFPRRGLPLTVRRSAGEDVLVALAGGIEVEALAPRSDLGVIVCEAGPVGEHFYAGNGNVLELRSGVSGGRVDVAATVFVKTGPQKVSRLPLRATIEARRLCEAIPPKRHAGTSEDPNLAHGWGEVDEEDFPKSAHVVDVPKDTPLTVFDRPGGAPLFARAPSEWGYSLVELRREGDFRLVAAGGGPYVRGWIAADAAHEPEPKGGLLGLMGSGSWKSPVALYTKKLARWPLHDLPAGTEIRMNGVVFARLTKPGLGRVSGEQDGYVFVTAAVDDDVTVKGWIPKASLGPRHVDRAEQGD